MKRGIKENMATKRRAYIQPDRFMAHLETGFKVVVEGIRTDMGGKHPDENHENVKPHQPFTVFPNPVLYKAPTCRICSIINENSGRISHNFLQT